MLLVVFITLSSCQAVEQATGIAMSGSKGSGGLSKEEVVSGLKEALRVGAKEAAESASRQDGFLKNPDIRIPFPPEAQAVKKKAMDLGLDRQVNRFETTLNRAAENAAGEAAPVFVDAIQNLTVREAFDILNGSDRAATEYLKQTTSDRLREKFAPVVSRATDEVQLTQYWTPLMQKYNAVTTFTGGEQVNPDLNAYVTDRTLDGLFTLIAQEEKKIRNETVARTTELLQRVFGRSN
jgi:hypothetical protein